MSVPKKRGRPTRYSDELAQKILSRLAEGESLASICAGPYIPPHPTVLLWVKENYGADENGGEGFADRYVRAREAGCEKIAESIIEISDANYTLPDGTVDNAAVQQARLRVDARKWYLSKILPKRFGDRVVQELVGSSDQPIVSKIELVAVAPRPRLEADVEVAGAGEASVTQLRALPSR